MQATCRRSGAGLYAVSSPPHVDPVQRLSLHGPRGTACSTGWAPGPCSPRLSAPSSSTALVTRNAGRGDLQLATAWPISVLALDDRLERAGDPAATRRLVDEVLDPARGSGPNPKKQQKGHLAGARRGVAPARRLSEESRWARSGSAGHVRDDLEATVGEAGCREPPSAGGRGPRRRGSAPPRYTDPPPASSPWTASELPAAAVDDYFAAMRRSAGTITAILNDLGVVAEGGGRRRPPQHRLGAAARARGRPVETAWRGVVAWDDTPSGNSWPPWSGS